METTPILSNQTSAIIMGLCTDGNDALVSDDLDELTELLKTLGIETRGRIAQKRPKLTASHLIGLGKVEEIKKLVEEKSANLVVVDHPLSGPQVRNLEEEIGCRVTDRAGIILEIFAKHAKTNQAKTQVKIAQLEYLLPRLAGAWSHFGKQSGSGISRGMGETQIEVDRRRAREKITRLKKSLEQFAKEKDTQRKQRRNELNVALIGYTNSGKTSIMHALTTTTTQGKDELFATLDTQTKSIDPALRPKILLSDTVGFIRNLPHGLFESFKSTLHEVTESDLLLHVVDASHPNYPLQIETTRNVLKEIGASEIPTLLVFNKIDRVHEIFLGKILERTYERSLCISAFNRADIARLRNAIFEYFQTQFHQSTFLVKPTDQQALSAIYRSSVILNVEYLDSGDMEITIKAPGNTMEKLKRYKMASL